MYADNQMKLEKILSRLIYAGNLSILISFGSLVKKYQSSLI